MAPNAGQRRPRGQFARLEVELLEERTLLDAASFTTLPAVPIITESMKLHLQAVFAQGLQRGNQPNVFAKVGDSITILSQYLNDLGSAAYNPSDPAVAGPFTSLAATINYFRGQPLPGGVSFVTTASEAAPLLPQPNGTNSFNRASAAAHGGWTTSNLLDPAEGYPEAFELLTIHPSFALIMIGTNDVTMDIASGGGSAGFQTRLTEVVQSALALGVIPVLSTIPDIAIGGGFAEATALAYNQIIANVAGQLNIPLWNYWLALQSLPFKGLSSDGVHPSSSPLGASNFTPFGLQFGFNVRNVTAVQVLDKLLHTVIQNGPPDLVNLPLTAPTIQYVTSLYGTLLGRAPDPGGMNTWGEWVENAFPRQQVVQAIWQSPEHRAAQVGQYYATYLHRSASPAEQSAWVSVFLAGATEEQVQAAFLTSPEYQAVHPSASDFVAGLYADVLGRPADQAGQSNWELALQTGMGRAQAALSFLQTPEYQQKIIAAYYQAFLNRPADTAGEQGWLQMLRQNGLSTESAGEGILASDEYFGVAH
jgi:hypothetical protein